MGGFIGGMVAGAVVVLILGAVVSLNTPLANKPVVATQTPGTDAASTPEAPEAIAGVGKDADLVKLPPRAPETAEDSTEEAADLSLLETTPDTQPAVTDAAQSLTQPESEGTTTEVTVATETPAAPSAPEVALQTPLDETVPVVIDETPEPPAQPEEVAVPRAEPNPEPIPKTEDVVVANPEPEPLTLPRQDTTEEVNPFENSPIAVEGDEDTLPRELPRIAALPQIGGDQPETNGSIVGKRVVPLTERDNAADTTEAAVEVPLGKPIQAYAAAFENPEAKPLMSIILIDDEGAFGAEALQDFPYPISFAVSPSDPQAAEKMARHRAAGFEVMALADLPQAATAQDAEVSLAVWLDALPETVGILEGVDTGIQGNRKLADQVAAIAGVTGRGLITQDNGLNTVQKLAARNGVPSGVIFRDIDGARQDPKIMRRFLDQAAFRAGQEGQVVMLGRVRPETISALLLWGLEDRGSRVAMAPISAVMMREIQ